MRKRINNITPPIINKASCGAHFSTQHEVPHMQDCTTCPGLPGKSLLGAKPGIMGFKRRREKSEVENM